MIFELCTPDLIVDKITWNNVPLRHLFQGAAEYLSKISNTVINLLGIFGLIIGIAEIQQLQFRNPEMNTIHLEMDLVSVTGSHEAFFRFKKYIFLIEFMKNSCQMFFMRY